MIKPATPSPTPLAPSPSAAGRPKAAGPAPCPGSSGPAAPAGPAAGPALVYAAPALARLAELMGDPDPKVVLSACREILDRAWGKAEAAPRPDGRRSGPALVLVRAGEEAPRD